MSILNSAMFLFNSFFSPKHLVLHKKFTTLKEIIPYSPTIIYFCIYIVFFFTFNINKKSWMFGFLGGLYNGTDLLTYGYIVDYIPLLFSFYGNVGDIYLFLCFLFFLFNK